MIRTKEAGDENPCGAVAARRSKTVIDRRGIQQNYLEHEQVSLHREMFAACYFRVSICGLPLVAGRPWALVIERKRPVQAHREATQYR